MYGSVPSEVRKGDINADRTAPAVRGVLGTSYVVNDELVEGTKIAHQPLHIVKNRRSLWTTTRYFAFQGN